MPSLQTALPPELANNAIRLYRECLRRAKYIGQKQYNTELLVDMVRQQFKKRMHETDPEKIQKFKDDAARGLINHMLYESEEMSGANSAKALNSDRGYHSTGIIAVTARSCHSMAE